MTQTPGRLSLVDLCLTLGRDGRDECIRLGWARRDQKGLGKWVILPLGAFRSIRPHYHQYHTLSAGISLLPWDDPDSAFAHSLFHHQGLRLGEVSRRAIPTVCFVSGPSHRTVAWRSQRLTRSHSLLRDKVPTQPSATSTAASLPVDGTVRCHQIELSRCQTQWIPDIRSS